MDDFYLLSKSETLYDATGAITAVLGEYPNLSGILTVPEGEWWYVHRFTCEASIALPAGETHAVAPALITIGPAGAGITPWSLYPHSTFATPQRPIIGVETNSFWMKNGDRLGVYLTNVIGASLTVAYELKALVTRLSI